MPASSHRRSLIWLASLLVMLGNVFASIRFAHRPSDFVDFGQFYMASVISRAGAWGDLYPRPMPGSNSNAGFPEASTMSPRYANAAMSNGVGDDFRYINPPPLALFVWPLSLFKPSAAKWVWVFVLALCGWMTAALTGLFFEHLKGSRRSAAPLIALLLAFSPRMFRAVCMCNISTGIALTTAVALAGMLWRRNRLAAMGFVLGAATKYATLALLPILVAGRRWRLLVEMLIAGIALLVICVCIMGTGPFTYFLSQIAPTLGRSTDLLGNESVAIIVAKWGGSNYPTHGESLAIDVVQWSIAAALLIAIFRAGVRLNEPVILFAAAGGLYAWMLIFSPIFWQHYVVYVYPFWGWLMWEAGRRGWARFLAVFAVAATWFPSSTGMGSILGGRMGHLVDASHYLLIAMFAVVGLAMYRLLCDTSAIRLSLSSEESNMDKQDGQDERRKELSC